MAGKLTAPPITVHLNEELSLYCRCKAEINETSTSEYVRGLIEQDREKAEMQYTLLAQALGKNGSLITISSPRTGRSQKEK